MRDLLLPASDEEREWVLHVDLDQFLAAVEVLRRPELARAAGRRRWRWGPDAPAAGRRDGVVRGEGVRASAQACRCEPPLRKCPDAVFLPVDRPAYDAASAEVMATLRSLGVRRRGVGLGRGVRRRADDRSRRRSPRRVQATVYERTESALRGRDRGDEAAGQDRDGLRQAGRRRRA